MSEQVKQKARTINIVITLCFIVIFLLAGYFFIYRRNNLHSPVTLHSGTHILILLSDVGEQLEDFQRETSVIADRYNLRIEFTSFSSVADQKRMLSLVPLTDIDAVLFWPLSSSEKDYCQELQACMEAGIPVVLVGHDFNNKDLRASFIGSGMNSELMIINQTLWQIDGTPPILIGGYSYIGNEETYELLILETNEHPEFIFDGIQNEQLKSFAQNTPSGYYPSKYIQINGQSGSTASLNMALVQMLTQQTPPLGLTFSLDEKLTNALVTGIESKALPKETLGTVIGYGKEDALIQYIHQGILDKLLTSNVVYSSSIGLRYLNDVLKGLWVPSTMDAGVKLIT